MHDEKKEKRLCMKAFDDLKELMFIKDSLYSRSAIACQYRRNISLIEMHGQQKKKLPNWNVMAKKDNKSVLGF